MSGETEASVSGWTTDTLHTHFMRQMDLLREAIAEWRRGDSEARAIAFRAQETAMTAALASAEKAVTAAMAAAEMASQKADTASEKRFDSVNEFRAQQSDIIRTFMPRAEAEAIIQRATERIQELTTAMAQTVSRAEMDAQHVRDTERITDLATRLTKAESTAQAAKDSAEAAKAGRAWMLGLVGAGFTLVIVVIAIANFLTQ